MCESEILPIPEFSGSPYKGNELFFAVIVEEYVYEKVYEVCYNIENSFILVQII